MTAAVSRETVLLVDDEPQVLVALEDLLSDEFTVLKTESPEEALNMAGREHDIAVVLTDQRMPRMGGDELLARLGESSRAIRILVTGFADLTAVVRAVNEGKIFAYVTKPWNAEDLRLKVHKAAEHFRLAHELAQERQLLHDLMDNIPDGIYFKDRDLRFQRVNRSFAAMLRTEPEALVGRRLGDVPFLSKHASAVEDEERRVLELGKLALDTLRHYPTDSKARWFSETTAPVKGQDAEIVGLVGISRDVTERIATNEALRVSEGRFREQSRILNLILDSMGEGVIVADRAGEFLMFNRQAEKILGVDRSMVSPSNWVQVGLQIFGKKGLEPGGESVLQRALGGEETVATELVVQNSTVKGAIIAVAGMPLRDDQGAITGGIAVIRDVTKQRELEQQLTQSQKMEAIGQLAGGVAHDFNNLLAVIQSYAALVLQDLPEGDPKRDDMDQVIAASKRAAGLTRQLLAFSRRRMIQPVTLQLNEIVSSIEKMLGRVIGEDIDLMVNLEPALGNMLADAGQLEQIVLNLTVNARDAMPGGGRILIETSNVVLGERFVAAHPGAKAGDYILLQVTDTGTGMDPETQRRIFEPFFTTKEVGKGTGLGLSTVYGIVQQCGGHIALQSELGKGSVFSVYFPRVNGRVDVPSHMPRVAATSSSETILLVEDDAAVLQVTARILRSYGFTVLIARQPEEARNYCKEKGDAIALLVTDVVMPEISGPKLAEELLQLNPKMRVLFMSGYPGGKVATEELLESRHQLLEKPFSPAKLVEKVRLALDGPLTATDTVA